MTPAAPASSEPMKNVETMTRSTSIPCIAAASRSNAVARIAFPRRVRATSSVSASISPNEVRMTPIRTRRDVERAPVDAAREVDVLVRLVAAEVGAEEQERRGLEEERDAERRDQRGDARRVPERPVGEALDHDAERARAHHRRHQHREDDEEHRRRQWRDRPTEQREHGVAREGAHHVHLAVGEVQQLEDPVHHRVPEGDQGVDGAEREPVHHLLDEEVGIHVPRCCLVMDVRPTQDGRAARVEVESEPG